MNPRTGIKKFRPRRKARTKAEIEAIRKRVATRRKSLIEKRKNVLKELDRSVLKFRSVLKVLKTAKERNPSITVKEFLKESKSNLLNQLSFMKENSDKFRFSELQVRSIDVFSSKLSTATTIEELDKVFEYFFSKSCILKVK